MTFGPRYTTSPVCPTGSTSSLSTTCRCPSVRATPHEPTRSQERVGSCGVALTDGHLQVVDSDEVLPVGQTGEVVYRGPNVMLGYAEARADLVAGDVTGGVLHTGDLGRLDADGFLY